MTTQTQITEDGKSARRNQAEERLEQRIVEVLQSHYGEAVTEAKLVEAMNQMAAGQKSFVNTAMKGVDNRLAELEAGTTRELKTAHEKIDEMLERSARIERIAFEVAAASREQAETKITDYLPQSKRDYGMMGAGLVVGVAGTLAAQVAVTKYRAFSALLEGEGS